MYHGAMGFHFDDGQDPIGIKRQQVDLNVHNADIMMKDPPAFRLQKFGGRALYARAAQGSPRGARFTRLLR